MEISKEEFLQYFGSNDIHPQPQPQRIYIRKVMHTDKYIPPGRYYILYDFQHKSQNPPRLLVQLLKPKKYYLFDVIQCMMILHDK